MCCYYYYCCYCYYLGMFMSSEPLMHHKHVYLSVKGEEMSTSGLQKLKRPSNMHVCTHVHVPYPSKHTRVPYCHITPPHLPRLQGDELTVMVHFLQMDF